MAFQADDPNHHLFITSSSDGVTWPDGTYIANIQIGSAPAMAVFGGKLYVAFRANDTSNNLFIASSSDGVNFNVQFITGQTMGWSSSPALVVNGGVLYYLYEANDAANELLVTASTDGSTWQGPAAYTGIQVGAAGPAATAYENGIVAGFQSYDSRNVMFEVDGVSPTVTSTPPGTVPSPCHPFCD